RLVAAESPLDPASLPCREELVARLGQVRRRGAARSLISAMRPHQWAKNALIFVPAIAGHRIVRLPVLTSALIAFVAFSLCASAIYLVNDILDIRADRLHPRKRTRPFAAGDLSVPAGMVAAILLLATAMALA